MKTSLIVILIALMSQFSTSAQFSFRVFPVGVGGDPYADTILNTRAILSAAGIRQVNAYQTLADQTRTFGSKIVNLDRDGSIVNLTTCFTKKNESNPYLCTYDTIVYAPSVNLVNINMIDSKGHRYPTIVINYLSKKEVVITQDSSVSYQSYNEKKQLVGLLRFYKGTELENTRYYYNSDGLLDSTYNTHWGTFIFKRREKGKDKVISMENKHLSYKWVYNIANQCIGHTIISKDLPNVNRGINYNGDIKYETRYFYNKDGTLAKCTIKRSDMPEFTMYYSYLKF
jgi:hypothetical protein